MSRLLKGMPYTPSEKTDIQNTWRKFGWVPKIEQESMPKVFYWNRKKDVDKIKTVY